MVDVRTVIADFERAIAYYGIAAGLLPFFRQRHMDIFGVRRWLIVLCLLLAGALQIVILLLLFAGRDGLAHDAAVAAATAILLVMLGLQGFFRFMKTRSAELVDAKIEQRLAAALAAADESRAWLLMGEEMAQVGHWRIGLPDRVLFWSDEIYRIHGLTKQDYAPSFETAVDAFHPDDRAMILAAVERAVAERVGYEWEARLVRPDGQIRNVLSRGIIQCDEAGTLTGIFGVFKDITEQKATEATLRRANLAAEQANGVLRDLALLDPLTGLPNRRRFDMAWESETKRAAREGTALALIMIDLDHFKTYNDQYGHPAGDECLRKVAAAIAAVPHRPGDLTARYGGEEFVVLMPNTDTAGAALVAARIVAAVAALQLPHLANPTGVVTVSCGAAACAPPERYSCSAPLIEAADRALYKAKAAGRNRVVQAARAEAIL
jgi:diguanylate cyclase (GGDEF)-like protein/PAS domain S-box-containing protein